MTNSSASPFFGLDLSALGARWTSLQRKISQRYLLLEFRNDSLLFSEVYFNQAKVNYLHVGIESLPEGSVELGVPVEPEKMSGLLQQICMEKGINVHRCAVVLPPEASFVSVVRLPSSLSIEEAWDFAQSPDSGLQIPIPLQQTDFDLIPLQHLWKSDEFESPYLLSGVPRTLVDSLIATLNLAGLELCDLSLSMTAHSRLLCSQIVSLNTNSYFLLLEFQSECTTAIVFSASGPVLVSRLASIREFPEPGAEVTDLVSDSVLDQSLSVESIVVADDRYLPISELDLQVLVHEARELIIDFQSSNTSCLLQHVYLTGSGSCHPGLELLLQNALDFPVTTFRASEASGIGMISKDSLLLSQSLGRLLGLGLHLVPDKILLQNSEFNLQDSVFSSAETLKSTPLFENPRLLIEPSNPRLLSAPSTDEFNEAKSIYTPQHPSNVPIDLAQESNTNTSLAIDNNNSHPTSMRDQPKPQSISIDSGADELIQAFEADSIDQPFSVQKNNDDETLSPHDLDAYVGSPPSTLEFPNPLEPSSESNNSQVGSSSHENGLLLGEEYHSILSSKEYVENEVDVQENELSAILVEPPDISDQVDLGHDTDEWPSISLKDGSESPAEVRTCDGTSQAFQNRRIEELNSSDVSENQNLFSESEMSWPSIRKAEFNKHELEGPQSSEPDVSLNEISADDSQSSFLSPSHSSEDHTDDLDITSDPLVTDQSDLSDLKPQVDEEEGLGELRFSDD